MLNISLYQESQEECKQINYLKEKVVYFTWNMFYVLLWFSVGIQFTIFSRLSILDIPVTVLGKLNNNKWSPSSKIRRQSLDRGDPGEGLAASHSHYAVWKVIYHRDPFPDTVVTHDTHHSSSKSILFFKKVLNYKLYYGCSAGLLSTYLTQEQPGQYLIGFWYIWYWPGQTSK